MKKLFLLVSMMIAIHVAKAQFTTINLTNSAGVADLYVRFDGNSSGPACSVTNSSGDTGPITTGTYTFTVSGLSWPPPTPVLNFVNIGFDLIPPPPLPMNPGPLMGLCPAIPLSPHAYVFSSGGTVYHITYTIASPGVLNVDFGM